MKRAALLLSALALLPVWFSSPAAHARGTEPTQLKAEPLEGHPGDTIYLSGGGFPANTQLQITMGCPNYHALGGNVTTWANSAGPTTNAQGTFVGYQIKAWKLTGLTESQCIIYAAVGPNPYGVEIPALYYLRAPGDPLSKAARHIQVSVKARPPRARGGNSEHIQLAGWPGATATISLRYPGRSVQKRTIQLNWEGTGSLQWAVNHVRRDQTAHVTALVRLGPSRGTGSAKFLILH